jgi:hypothetical protein
VNPTPAVVVACALLFIACGDSDEPSRSTVSAPTKVSDRTVLVDEANGICRQVRPGIDQTSEQIQAAATARETRAAWTAQYRVVSDLFSELRSVEKAGVDRRYDAFLARLGSVLQIVERVPRDVGDEQELSATFYAMQEYVNEMGEAARAAGVTTCRETFRPAAERQG